MEDHRKKRCKELYERWTKGEYLVDLVSDLSEKYDVKENTIYKDWNTRHNWLDKVFQSDPGENKEALSEILTRRRIIEMELWQLYSRTNSDKVKLGALKRLDKKTETLFDDLQKSGIIEKAADKLEVESTSEISIAEEIAGIKEAMEDGSEEQNKRW